MGHTFDELVQIMNKPYPIRTVEHGSKHAICPVCGKKWDVGKKGGGLVVGAVMRHMSACARKAIEQMI